MLVHVGAEIVVLELKAQHMSFHFTQSMCDGLSCGRSLPTLFTIHDINRIHHVHNLGPTALRRSNMSSKNDVRSKESRLDYRTNSSTEQPNN